MIVSISQGSSNKITHRPKLLSLYISQVKQPPYRCSIPVRLYVLHSLLLAMCSCLIVALQSETAEKVEVMV